jgi:hypothetical protein
VETAMAAVQARLIKSILTFRIIIFSKFKELLVQFVKDAVMTVNALPS